MPQRFTGAECWAHTLRVPVDCNVQLGLRALPESTVAVCGGRAGCQRGAVGSSPVGSTAGLAT